VISVLPTIALTLQQTSNNSPAEAAVIGWLAAMVSAAADWT